MILVDLRFEKASFNNLTYPKAISFWNKTTEKIREINFYKTVENKKTYLFGYNVDDCDGVILTGDQNNIGIGKVNGETINFKWYDDHGSNYKSERTELSRCKEGSYRMSVPISCSTHHICRRK